MVLTRLDAQEAERIVENLRFGVPPPEYVRTFTVGREEELKELQASLESPSEDTGAALLVRANYGAGKSHLLQIVREMALEANYATSLVVVNAQEGVRFNRMDTVFGAVCREIEVKGFSSPGVGALFDAYAAVADKKLSPELDEFRARLSSNGRWDHSELLEAPGIYIALRAWLHSQDGRTRNLIVDWLQNPQNYRGQRKLLYQELVEKLRSSFRDPRAEWQYYAEEVFIFHTGGHRQSWDALSDLHQVARLAGCRGLILLFDEFEDVVQNLNRRDLQEQAFLNLFRFFTGDRYPGMSYFAVTPDFVEKCKVELLTRGVYDFDFSRFDDLPFFELSEISQEDFVDLARRIRSVHALAYSWEAESLCDDVQLRGLAQKLWTIASPDRVRRAIQGVVEALDESLEGG
jgi:hypothetical protein